MENNKENQIYKRYDKAYKQIFSDTEVIIDLLKRYLKPEVFEMLDLKTLINVDKELIGIQGNKREVDCVYKVNTKDGSDVYLYFIIEFQSSIDKLMPLRIFIYKALLYMQLIDRGILTTLPIPPIFPFVFYNGDLKWNAKEDVFDLYSDKFKNTISDYLPKLKYLLIDKNNYTLEDIEKMRDMIGVILFSENYDIVDMKDFTEKLFDIFPKSVNNKTKVNFIYFLKSIFGEDINFEELSSYYSDKLHEIVDFKGEVKMGIAKFLERRDQEVTEKVKKEAKLEYAKEMLYEGIDEKKVVKITKLSIEEIIKLKNSL